MISTISRCCTTLGTLVMVCMCHFLHFGIDKDSLHKVHSNSKIRLILFSTTNCFKNLAVCISTLWKEQIVFLFDYLRAIEMRIRLKNRQHKMSNDFIIFAFWFLPTSVLKHNNRPIDLSIAKYQQSLNTHQSADYVLFMFFIFKVDRILYMWCLCKFFLMCIAYCIPSFSTQTCMTLSKSCDVFFVWFSKDKNERHW